MKDSNVVKALGTEMPTDYQTYVSIPQLQGRTLQLGEDRLKLWTQEAIIQKTKEQRQAGVLIEKDLLFASLEETDLQLFYRYNEHSGQHLLYDLNSEGEIYFHAFGLGDYFSADAITRILLNIDEDCYQPKDLDAIRHCPDGLHTIAFELYSFEEHRIAALKLYQELADIGHTESASELADQHEDQGDIGQSLAWREKAVQLGHYGEKYELADLLLEHYPERAQQALELLQHLLQQHAYSALAAWRLASFYLQPHQPHYNAQQGIQYLQQSADQGNYYALADLAFQYYEGKALPQNTQTAYDLLKQAEQSAIQETGSSNWTHWMDRLASELIERPA